MADVTLSFEDGTEHRYTGVPDDATPDAVIERASRDFSGKTLKHVARTLLPQDPPPSPKTGDTPGGGGFLRSLADIAGKAGDLITGRTGARQRLEQQAGGVSVMEPPPSDFELQRRAGERASLPPP